jgi:hypothetical protein
MKAKAAIKRLRILKGSRGTFGTADGRDGRAGPKNATTQSVERPLDPERVQPLDHFCIAAFSDGKPDSTFPENAR